MRNLYGKGGRGQSRTWANNKPLDNREILAKVAFADVPIFPYFPSLTAKTGVRVP